MAGAHGAADHKDAQGCASQARQCAGTQSGECGVDGGPRWLPGSGEGGGEADGTMVAERRGERRGGQQRRVANVGSTE